MAVAKMKKVTIFASRDIKEAVFEKLRDLEIMEVTATEESREQLRQEAFTQEVPPEVKENLEKLSHISSYLTKYNPPKKGFIDMFTGKKPEVSYEDLKDTVKNYDVKAFYTIVQEHEERLKVIGVEENKLMVSREQFLPWAALDLPISHLEGTSYTGSFLATVNASALDVLRESAQEQNLAIHFETVWEDRGKVGLWVVYLAEDFEKARGLVASVGGATVSLDSADISKELTVQQVVDEFDTRLQRLTSERTRIQDEDMGMSQNLLNVLALWDYYKDKENLAEEAKKARKTVYTLAVTGFVKLKDMPVLREAFEGFSELVVTDEDPGPDDDVPVYLENHPLIRPFEVITNIFGFPQYTEIDPTPVLAPFFWVFFGICLGDAVYGIVLALGCWFFMRTQKLTDGGKKMVTLLMYSGVSTIIMGAIMGSWLADLPSVFFGGTSIDRLAQSVAVLDPIGDPLTLLALSFALGIFQVWVGIIVNMWGLIKSGQVLEGILSQGSWVVTIGGGVVWIGAQVFGYGATIPLFITGVGALMVVYAASRSQKNILLKPFTGLYGLYSIVGYFSDTMSYSRLLALGLASAVVGVVVNKIAELIANMIPVVGWAFVPFVLLGGHVFNLTINVLGSFIHSGRLQFVEFFTKFFEGGGKPFKPLGRVSDNVWLS